MARRTGPTRRLGAALLASVFVLIGFAGSGAAASQDMPSNTKRPSISGTPMEGSKLTADRGEWANSPTGFDYQWRQCDTGGGNCVDVGNDDEDYTPTSSDVGHRMKVRVRASNADGTSDWTDSDPTAVVAAKAVAPSNTSAPTISGTPQDNQTLTATDGTWNGTTPITFAYRWERCDGNGANCQNTNETKKTYAVASRDVGSRLRVIVVATNSAGSSAAVSAATGVVTAAAAAPRNTVVPAIQGTTRDGQILTATTGTWSGATPITYTYQWQRCDANGNACAPIPGATAATYRLTAADTGRRLRVTVSARNNAGSSTATSAPTAVVGAAGAAGAPIAITNVSLPNRLVVDRVSFSPPSIGSRLDPVIGRFHVVDSNGNPVQGALLYAVGVPANRVSFARETITDASGWASVVFQPLRGLPLRNGALLTVFVRARKPGENLLGGVSTRRLVSIRVHPAA